MKIVLVLTLLIVGFGMMPTVVPWMATPADRVFNGIHGYSSDYIQYVSYIKEGMYGRYSMLFRSFPFPQPATPIHFLYIATGVIANIVSIESAPFAYHLARLLLGVLFVFVCFRFFLLRFSQPTEAALVTFLAFVSSPFFSISTAGGTWAIIPLKYLNFYIESAGRVSDRPHYIFGETVFLFLVLLLFRTKLQKPSWIRSPVLLFFLSFAMAMVHAGTGIIALCVFLAWFLLDRKNSFRIFTIIIGITLALAISFWSIRQYTMVPEIWLDSYSGSASLLPLIRDILSFGPTLPLAFAGLILAFLTSKKRETLDLFVLVWLVVWMGLFLYGYRWFHADRVRFVQSLYFIPFAYGSAIFLKSVAMRFGKSSAIRTVLDKPLFFVLMSTVIFYSMVPFIKNFISNMYLFTDYRDFSIFAFPTKHQWAAYEFLDRNTAKESVVLAKYEAANNILIASHNRVIGNNQGWGVAAGQEMYLKRDRFLSGSMKEEEAHTYLSDNHIEYVYFGYQEKYMGDMRRYSFLTPVFSNSDVTIYTTKILKK